MLLRVTFGAFDLRQSNRRRRVRKRKPNKDDTSEGERGGNKESKSPTDYHEISTKNDNQSAADRMRDIPNRHAARQFLRGKPMGQQTRARREAHALKPAVRHPNQTHDHDCRIETEEHIHQCRRAQTEGHECSGIRAVTEKPIRKLRYAVKQTVESKKQTQLRLLEPKTALHHRHRDAEVFTHEIKRRVAHDRSQQDALLPVAILPGYVVSIVRFNWNGSRRREDSKQPAEGWWLRD